MASPTSTEVRLRDKPRNACHFDSLLQAKVLIEDWKIHVGITKAEGQGLLTNLVSEVPAALVAKATGHSAEMTAARAAQTRRGPAERGTWRSEPARQEPGAYTLHRLLVGGGSAEKRCAHEAHTPVIQCTHTYGSPIACSTFSPRQATVLHWPREDASR